MMGNMNINVKVDHSQSKENIYGNTNASNTFSYPKYNTLPVNHPYNYYGFNQQFSHNEGDSNEQIIESNYSYIPE